MIDYLMKAYRISDTKHFADWTYEDLKEEVKFTKEHMEV
jgi:hypothetical protein